VTLSGKSEVLAYYTVSGESEALVGCDTLSLGRPEDLVGCDTVIGRAGGSCGVIGWV
jgi:hypothetical protein